MMTKPPETGATMPSPSKWRARCSATRSRLNGQDPNEERYGVIGMVEGRLLFVGYTMRGEKIRIITARKAEPYERRRYHEENREA
jgi:uncharacterized DUF497 family protein